MRKYEKGVLILKKIQRKTPVKSANLLRTLFFYRTPLVTDSSTLNLLCIFRLPHASGGLSCFKI